jgi:hypothetical protein
MRLCVIMLYINRVILESLILNLEVLILYFFKEFVIIRSEKIA